MSRVQPGTGYRPARQPQVATARRYDGRLRVVLGPTNTGKTHLAIERMLGHSSGMIGLPLRLLAREVYDRLVKIKGKALVALITGEERIQPPNAAYFVCTVEAMPLERDVAFLAVDEIQLAADAERGHVFTDRLLRARGREETMFMGAASMRPILERLVPEAGFEERTRLSRLGYAGVVKLSRLPRRSAIAAFSANEVYALAELIRRHKGGAAVVMGALSPRTRNAQVALFENGDVDYLVATDAIGMGLNLNINHVAFSGLTKFDGQRRRGLTVAEAAQIAGRAGRHMTDGSFGTLADGGEMPVEMIDAIEDHRFPPVERLQWRSSNVDYSSLEHLIASLERPPATQSLALTREAEDLMVLKRLAQDARVRDLARGPAAVGLLWQVCRLPDFSKVMADIHSQLVASIYRHLMDHDGILPAAWLQRRVEPLNRTDGDIDSLAARLAHIRTYTYIAHQSGWLSDPKHWQGLTRDIEDRLSDALHERLTQRFVDRRSAVLMRSLKHSGPVLSGIDRHGQVTVEGEYVGSLEGLRFTADLAAEGEDRRLVMKAAREALKTELPRRVRALVSAPHDAFTLDEADLRIHHDGVALAALKRGGSWLKPGLRLLPNDVVDAGQSRAIEGRLADWLSQHVARVLSPLTRLDDVGTGRQAASGAVRAIAFQLMETGGIVVRKRLADQCRVLTKDDRRQLKALGVRLGHRDIYVPGLLKPAVARLKALLWRLHRGGADIELSAIGPVSMPAMPGLSGADHAWLGYRQLGDLAVRVDALDRFLTRLSEVETEGFIAAAPNLAATLGVKKTAVPALMTALGYVDAEQEVKGYRRGTAPKRRPRRPRSQRPSADGPMAALAALKAPHKGKRK